MADFDVAVVGLGALGSAVLYHLSQLNKESGDADRIIGIDAFTPPHKNGSHHGDTRITRLANGEGKLYVPFAQRSHALWNALAQETGDKFFDQRGVLIFGDPNSDAAMHGQSGFLRRTCALAEACNIKHKLLASSLMQSRYPGFKFQPKDQGYFESDGGILFPEKIIQAHISLSKNLGAQVCYGEAVSQWYLQDQGVLLATDSQTFFCKKVIFCVGAHISDFLPDHLARLFAIYRQTLIWLSVPASSSFRECSHPPFIRLGDNQSCHSTAGDFYGFPVISQSDICATDGLKIGIEQVTRASENPVDLSAPSVRACSEMLTALAPFLNWGEHLRPEIVDSATCHYTMTPDSHFRLGYLPDTDQRLYFVSACSGHGFKHSASLGEAIAQKIYLGQSTLDLTPFALV